MQVTLNMIAEILEEMKIYEGNIIKLSSGIDLKILKIDAREIIISLTPNETIPAENTINKYLK